MQGQNGADGHPNGDQELWVTQPQMNTSSQVQKTINCVTEPMKKERATKAEINRRMKVS